MILDTAALAVHLGYTPGQVRALVQRGVITPIGRKRVHRLGRPAMWFDVDAVDEALKTRRTGQT